MRRALHLSLLHHLALIYAASTHRVLVTADPDDQSIHGRRPELMIIDEEVYDPMGVLDLSQGEVGRFQEFVIHSQPMIPSVSVEVSGEKPWQAMSRGYNTKRNKHRK